MNKKINLTEDALHLIAEKFKVLSEPMRLHLLNLLQKGEKNVAELVQSAGTTQANVSKHLGILAKAGMVGRRKEGLNTFYSIKDPMIFRLCELVCSGIQKEMENKLSSFSPSSKKNR